MHSLSGLGYGALHPAPDSMLSRRRAQREIPGAFDCGVRVLNGKLQGERAKWTFRQSALDGKVLRHGPRVRLRLELNSEQDTHPLKYGYLVWSGTELDSGAEVEVSCTQASLDRLIDAGIAHR